LQIGDEGPSIRRIDEKAEKQSAQIRLGRIQWRTIYRQRSRVSIH
jgi:hypothetical protein